MDSSKISWRKKIIKTSIPLLSALFAVALSILIVPPSAFSEEGTCYLEAVTDVYVEVYDLDRQGNDGEMIWSGRLNDGETVLIKAPHARFRYKFNNQPDEKQPLSVGPDKWRDGKHSVAVPLQGQLHIIRAKINGAFNCSSRRCPISISNL